MSSGESRSSITSLNFYLRLGRVVITFWKQLVVTLFNYKSYSSFFYLLCLPDLATISHALSSLFIVSLHFSITIFPLQFSMSITIQLPSFFVKLMFWNSTAKAPEKEWWCWPTIIKEWLVCLSLSFWKWAVLPYWEREVFSWVYSLKVFMKIGWCGLVAADWVLCRSVHLCKYGISFENNG